MSSRLLLKKEGERTKEHLRQRLQWLTTSNGWKANKISCKLGIITYTSRFLLIGFVGLI